MEDWLIPLVAIVCAVANYGSQKKYVFKYCLCGRLARSVAYCTCSKNYPDKT